LGVPRNDLLEHETQRRVPRAWQRLGRRPPAGARGVDLTIAQGENARASWGIGFREVDARACVDAHRAFESGTIRFAGHDLHELRD